MQKSLLLAAMFTCATSAGLAAGDNCGGNVPPIRSIDRTCLPAGAPQANMPMFNTDLAEHYQEIATVDSYISTDKCNDTTRMQLKDLQTKGQGIGADALIRVRMLANDVRGWKENPDTPFFSVKQGASQDYFFRATAIKYLRPPVGAPKPAAMPVQRAAVTEISPLINTNELLKLNNNKTRRHEMTMPEVYTTNQPQGAP